MSRESSILMRIKMEPGPSRRSLLRVLESYGGRYQVLHDPAIKRQEGGKGASSSEWISYGSQNAFFAPRMTKWAINKHANYFQGKSVESWQSRLRACGLRAELPGKLPSQAGRYLRRFVVRVFHLHAVQILPIGKMEVLPSVSREEHSDRQSLLDKRLEATAVRALYALELEMGEVVISAGEEGRFTVEGVTSTPDLRGTEAAHLFARAINETLDRLCHHLDKEELLIGMDPEFILYDKESSRVVPASRYLDRRGEAGCDSLRIQGRLLFPLVELRPAPGHEPREVMSHLLRAFRSAMVSISDKRLLWQAGGMPQQGFPLGGHLHFSGVPLSAELLRSLDNYLALPVSVLEDSRSFRRRPRYGFLGDFRIQPYGGFEYRTLPSFLISPLVTKGVVALSRLIAENVEALTARPLQDEQIYSAFYEGRQEVIRDILPPLIDQITALQAYPRYASYIAPFFEAVLSGRTWDESTDIRRHWKIQNPS
ncbi:putative amidoligase domain-containing protein [Paenibacillus segetis]|uniref:Phage phiEco32-like COOH.NH2 ligase-type 2 n=1 Tax=Paenibacillus segetis TaxID=1325360 RepID=A0ABQ1YFQ7_9BACL|nr:hypothetical protein [Paenibacillus segetis]GGH22927.1 hypothetical protein GCM10008013_21680 [Paenibacillus segetis]